MECIIQPDLDSCLVPAIRNGNIGLVKLLIKADVDVERLDATCNTLLTVAVLRGRIEIAKLLIDTVRSNPRRGTLKRFVNFRAVQGESPLTAAITFRRADIIRLLFANGARVNDKGLNDTTPLHLAYMVGTQEIIELLLARGANTEAKDKCGNVPNECVGMRGSEDNQE